MSMNEVGAKPAPVALVEAVQGHLPRCYSGR